MTTSSNTASTSTSPGDTQSARRHRLAVGLAATAAAAVGLIGILVISADAETVPRRVPATIEERQVADLKAIAEMARAEGLTGLSPASLRPAD